MVAPNLIVTNARIYSGDASAPEAEALASSNGRIVAVGSRRRLERMADARSEILDVEGRWVLPGFIDAHVHLSWAYELGEWIDLTDHPSLVAIQQRLREHVREHPDEPLVVGHGFDYAALGIEGLPNRTDLDGAVYDRPVLLTAWDGHTGWGNSRFVERAQATLARVGRELGEMQRDARTRQPNGIFLHSFDVTALMPEFQARRSVEGLRRLLTAAVGYGITTAFDVQVLPEEVSVYEDLRNRNELPLRIRAGLYHPRGTTPDSYPSFMAAVARSHDDWFGVGAVKLYIDGVQESGTAALLEPYANNPRSRGSTVYPAGEFRRIVRELDRLGFQILTHACGDRGVRLALDAYEAARRTNGMVGRRHRIEHCENLADEDIPRFAALDVVPCMMPRHSAPELTGRWHEAVGPARSAGAFAWRELLDHGAALAFSSDWPVAELNPWIGIRAAVTRNDAEGRPSPHRLTLAEAIQAYTGGAAYASHCEATRGSLVRGKYADLVVLSADPFEIPPERLDSIRVVATLVGGATKFADPEIRAG